MKRKHFLIGLALVPLAVLLLLFWPKSPQPRQSEGISLPSHRQSASGPKTPPAALAEVEEQQHEKRRALVAGIESMLKTPITFYGRVVDQRGDPVAHAEVEYGLLDKFNEPGSVGKSSADESGHFTIRGVRGAAISVSVNKEGYYFVEALSKGSFAYGHGPDSTTKPAPSRDDPAVFVLQKMGEPEPLIMVESRTFRIRRDGTPVWVDLTTGKVSDAGQLKVEAWTGERVPGGPRFYDWRCRISVPGGGLVEREGQFVFEAPADGYREFDEMVMPKDADQWSGQSERQYFIKLPEGRFARIKFKMIAGGDHFFRLESYFNPRSGSRNLEYDSANRIKP